MQTQSGDYTVRLEPFFGGNRTIFLPSHKVWQNLSNLRSLRDTWEPTCWGGGGWFPPPPEMIFCKTAYISSIHPDHLTLSWHTCIFQYRGLLRKNTSINHLFIYFYFLIIWKNLPKYGEYTYCTSQFIQDMVQITFALILFIFLVYSKQKYTLVVQLSQWKFLGWNYFSF